MRPSSSGTTTGSVRCGRIAPTHDPTDVRDFRPVTAPPGRLVRLALVLDPRNGAQQTVRIAQMAERAGLDALWVNDRLITDDATPRMEAWTMLSTAALYTDRIRVGAMLTSGLRTPQSMAAMAGSLDTILDGRIELGVATASHEEEFVGLGLPYPDPGRRVGEMAEFAGVLTRLTRGETAVESGAVLGFTSPQPGGPAVTIEAYNQPELEVAVDLADNVLLPMRPLDELHALVARARQTAERAGRDAATLGFAVQLPVSVGRTDAESDVRVEIDDLLAQVDTKTLGVHGTLEHCQDTMIELAHLGFGEVRCVLPNVEDIDDVIAQLTATAIGTTDVLKPGMARSAAPDPPPGWGSPSRHPRPDAG